MSSPHKVWKARLIISIIMLVLALIGLIIIDLHSQSYWFYTQIMSFCYAGLSLWLFWYVHYKQKVLKISTIWHQLLHWFGTLLLIYLTSLFINTGIMGTTQAGLMTLSMLALSIFLCGVYTDPAFMLIGLTLAAFAACAAFIQAYLSIIMLPLIAIIAFIIFIIVRKKNKDTE